MEGNALSHIISTFRKGLAYISNQVLFNRHPNPAVANDTSIFAGLAARDGGLEASAPGADPESPLEKRLRAILTEQLDRSAYLMASPDVVAFGLDPVEHCLHYGAQENRLRRAGLLNPIFYDYGGFLNLTDRDLILADGGIFSTPHSGDRNSFVLKDKNYVCGIVAFKNSQHEILRLVRSIAVQDNACRILVYNNCPDYRYELEFSGDISIETIDDQSNCGFALGHNRLMQAAFDAGADFYIGLNPDGVLFPGAIGKALSEWREDVGIMEFLQEPISHPKFYNLRNGTTSWCSGAPFILDKQTHAETGGFDPLFPMYCEDIDLSYRVRMTGRRCVTARSAHFFHDVSDREGAEDSWRRVRSLIGELYLSRKWKNGHREALIARELQSVGVDVAALQPPPTMITPDPSIERDMLEPRYAPSRYWR